MRSNLTYRNPSPRTLRSSSSPPPKTGAPRFYRTSPCPSSIAFGLYSFLFSRFSGDTLHSVSAFRLFSGSRERERERERNTAGRSVSLASWAYLLRESEQNTKKNSTTLCVLFLSWNRERRDQSASMRGRKDDFLTFPLIAASERDLRRAISNHEFFHRSSAPFLRVDIFSFRVRLRDDFFHHSEVRVSDPTRAQVGNFRREDLLGRHFPSSLSSSSSSSSSSSLRPNACD